MSTSTYFRVEKNKNYTVMANYHLNDRRLSLKAKGLMSFMLSLSDSWDLTVNGLAGTAKDGIDSINTTLNELEKYGYVTRKRIRNEKGQLKGIEYTIYENPNDNKPITDEKTADKPIRENPKQAESSEISPTQPNRENPVLGNPVLENPILENPVQTNTNNKTNTKETNTKSLSLSYRYNTDEDKMRYEHYAELVRENIDYRNFSDGSVDREIADGIVGLIADVCVSTHRKTRLGKDKYVNTQLLKSKLLKLRYDHIVYVIESLKSVRQTDIKYKDKYLLTALYKAPDTIGLYNLNTYGVI